MPYTLEGRTFYVPGVYAVTHVALVSGQALPTFNVGLIIAPTRKGTSYALGTGNTPATADTFIKPYTSATDVKADFGFGDAVKFFRYAKKTGAGVVYMLSAQSNTSMSGGTIANVTPVAALTMSTKKNGAEQNDTSITIAAYVHTIIPPKNTVFLTVDSGTVKTITVEDVSPYKVGDTVLLSSNTHAVPESLIIESINTALLTITFTTAIAATATLANYGRIFQADTDNQEVSTTLDTGAKVLAFYGQSKYFSTVIASGITLMPITLAKTYAQNLTTATKATSPISTTTDFQNIADNFQRWNEEFAIVNKFYIRVLGLVTADSTNHAAYASLATTMRGVNKGIAIVTGCASGDVNLASSAAGFPVKRAYALNSDNVQLAGIGLDGDPAYASLAGELFGIRVSNDVRHNQTNDDIVASTLEKGYFREDANLPQFTAGGVVMGIATKTGFKVSQGVSTYQDQTTTFNTASKSTYLVRNRDIADYKLRTIMDILETQFGDESVTMQSLSSAVGTAGQRLVDLSYLMSYRIKSIVKEGNAWTINDEGGIDSPTDFIGLVSTLVVN